MHLYATFSRFFPIILFQQWRVCLSFKQSDIQENFLEADEPNGRYLHTEDDTEKLGVPLENIFYLCLAKLHRQYFKWENGWTVVIVLDKFKITRRSGSWFCFRKHA
jgi:hypothetical protein